MFLSLLIVIIIFFLISLRQINPNQIGIVFRFDKFVRIIQPGWRIVILYFENLIKINPGDTFTEKQLMDFMKMAVPPEIIDKLRKIS